MVLRYYGKALCVTPLASAFFSLSLPRGLPCQTWWCDLVWQTVCPPLVPTPVSPATVSFRTGQQHHQGVSSMTRSLHGGDQPSNLLCKRSHTDTTFLGVPSILKQEKGVCLLSGDFSFLHHGVSTERHFCTDLLNISYILCRKGLMGVGSWVGSGG